MPDEDIEGFEEDVEIRRNTIPDYMDPEYLECFQIWNYWNHGQGVLPFAGGWMEQPAHVIDVIETANDVYAKWQKRNKARGGK